MLEKIDGMKTYILGGFFILLAVIKMLTDIPDIEVLSIGGITEPITLLTTGWAIIAGRGAIAKIGN